MNMLHTTFRLARRFGASCADYRTVADALGGEGAYGLDRPITLTVVLQHTSLDSALWALRCVLPGEEVERDRVARLFACDCAEAVLPIVERVYPDDRRPRSAIETARRFTVGEATTGELAAAHAAAHATAWSAACAASWAAAHAAAHAAAGDAAGDAARDAGDAARDTYAASKAEQTGIFLGHLNVPEIVKITS